MGTNPLSIAPASTSDAHLANFRPFMSDIQIECFVVGANGNCHPWGSYKQVLRELNGRERSLRDYDRKLRLAQVDVDEKQAGGQTPRVMIEVEALLDNIEALRVSERDCRRERDTLLRNADALLPMLGDLTESHRAELERDHRLHQFAFRIAVGLETNQPPPMDLYECLPAMPRDMRLALLEVLAEPLVAECYYRTALAQSEPMMFRDHFEAAKDAAALELAARRNHQARVASSREPLTAVAAPYRSTDTGNPRGDE